MQTEPLLRLEGVVHRRRSRPHGEVIVILPLVEVRTRDGTVFSYLTKPIPKTLPAALTER